MQKDEKLAITKEKLMDATFQLMEKSDDPLKVTSRQIAERAGVLPAMINYCFGSRENLIYNTFQKQYLSFLDNNEVKKITESDLPPKELLKKIHFLVARCLTENYNFTRAITGFVLFKRDLSKGSFSYNYVMKHYNGKRSEQECKVIALELSSMMQLLIYRKDDLKKDFGIDLDDPEQLKRYIDMRVDLLLGD